MPASRSPAPGWKIGRKVSQGKAAEPVKYARTLGKDERCSMFAGAAPDCARTFPWFLRPSKFLIIPNKQDKATLKSQHIII